MSKRKYVFNVTDYAALKEKYPKSVTETVVHSHSYSYLAKLADCGLEIPGVEIEGDQGFIDFTGAKDAPDIANETGKGE